MKSEVYFMNYTVFQNLATTTVKTDANSLLTLVIPIIIVPIVLAIIFTCFKHGYDFFKKKGAEREKVIEEAMSTAIGVAVFSACVVIVGKVIATVLGVTGINIPGIS
ncbi:MAG: hypothetical protein Q8N88_03650 [Nanoarchaeota archaeon]|nr:hypothetical protein [Nanoarchaeota archaeon]